MNIAIGAIIIIFIFVAIATIIIKRMVKNDGKEKGTNRKESDPDY